MTLPLDMWLKYLLFTSTDRGGHTCEIVLESDKVIKRYGADIFSVESSDL